MDANHIALQLPPDRRWLAFLREGVQRYASVVGFSKPLEERIMRSVMEACEELIRVIEETGLDTPFHVYLNFKGQAAVIEIEYDGKIPLNPFDAEDYEVPQEAADLDNVTLDALWLFLIKKQMDRVFFRVSGSRRVLSIMHYLREEGQEKRLWVMAIKPELGKGLHLHLDRAKDGPPRSVLQKTGAGVLMLGPSETFFVQNMDGIKTFHDLYMDHVDAIGLVSPDLPARLYEQLETHGMLATSEDGLRQPRWKAILRGMLNPSFSIPNADRVVTVAHGLTRFFFTPLGVALLLLVGISGMAPLALHFDAFRHAVVGLEETLYDKPVMALPLYLLLLVHISLHEIGHGVACKHFGGATPRMGAMFYLTSFIFFCDTTAAYSFPEKRRRLLVSLAGPLVSFAIFGMGLWTAGALVDGGGMWGEIFVAFSIVNFFGLVMNFNPFIKMDAYYMLLDITGIPKLRARSFAFLRRRLLGWLGFGDDSDVRATLRERRLFWWYGVLGVIVTVAFAAIPLLHLSRILASNSPHGGRMLLVVAVCALLLARLSAVSYATLHSIRHRRYKLK